MRFGLHGQEDPPHGLGHDEVGRTLHFQNRRVGSDSAGIHQTSKGKRRFPIAFLKKVLDNCWHEHVFPDLNVNPLTDF